MCFQTCYLVFRKPYWEIELHYISFESIIKQMKTVFYIILLFSGRLIVFRHICSITNFVLNIRLSTLTLLWFSLSQSQDGHYPFQPPLHGLYEVDESLSRQHWSSTGLVPEDSHHFACGIWGVASLPDDVQVQPVAEFHHSGYHHEVGWV